MKLKIIKYLGRWASQTPERVPWSVRIVYTYIPLSPTVAFLIYSVPLMMEYLPVGREPSSLDQDTVVPTFFSGEHLNTADWPRATVRTAGDTTIPGAEVTSPACPLNGCIEVGVAARFSRRTLLALYPWGSRRSLDTNLAFAGADPLCCSWDGLGDLLLDLRR